MLSLSLYTKGPSPGTGQWARLATQESARKIKGVGGDGEQEAEVEPPEEAPLDNSRYNEYYSPATPGGSP
jgi:hypothetical protein